MRGDHRYWRIGVATALMGIIVAVAGSAFRGQSQLAQLPLTGVGDTPSIPSEAGTFRLASRALAIKQAPENVTTLRDLEQFYARRAYPGAPPIIPHPLLDKGGFGGRSCLACHADGGYVAPFKAYAPVTPHPELANCLQCHVAQSEGPLFSGSSWSRIAGPAINGEALPGGPPPMPHTLQLRDNCNACHAGPAAVKEIKTSHPERVNCRQCHVPSDGHGTFRRSPE
jgi:cytochrome c-type protein NapB